MTARGRKLAFCLDEHLSGAFASRLMEHGRHRVTSAMSGVDDRIVLQHADGILVTYDRHFADEKTYRPGTHRGIVQIATSSTYLDAMFGVFLKFLRSGHAAEADGAIVILHDQDFVVRTATEAKTYTYE